MNFEQPKENDFLSEIFRHMEDVKSSEWNLAKSSKYPDSDHYDSKLENQLFETRKKFLKRIAEQEGVIDKETLIVALRKHHKETTDEDERSMATMFLQEYL